MPILRRNWQTANASMKVASGSSVESIEKKWRDPDDVYIEVARREEERKKQGLPPRLGVLPHSAVAEEEDRWEAEQERKKERSKKARKVTVWENNHAEEAKDRSDWNHPCNPNQFPRSERSSTNSLKST